MNGDERFTIPAQTEDAADAWPGAPADEAADGRGDEAAQGGIAAGKEPTEPARASVEDRYNLGEGAPSETHARVYQNFGAAMGKVAAQPDTVRAAIAWLEKTYAHGAAQLTESTVAHPYDVRNFDFADVDQPYLHSFLNAMAARGASQSEVTAAVNWFTESRSVGEKVLRAQEAQFTAFAREVEAKDIDQRENARTVMLSEWGPDFQRNVDNIKRWLDGLPEDLRLDIEEELRPDGSLALNHPDRLRELAAIAETSLPSRPRPGVASEGMSREAIERTMRTARHVYDHDEAMQERYRELLAGGDEGEKPPPRGRDAVDAEISGFERLLRTDRAAYNKKSDRYLDLLRIRDGQN